MIEANSGGRWATRGGRIADSGQTITKLSSCEEQSGMIATKFPPRCDKPQQPLPARGERGMSVAMTEDEMRKRLEILRVEHRDLDAAIAALSENPTDQLRVARLKKRKLLLKDQILLLEDALIPDIIA